MNTERYLWPVIIAAGLHGALLFSFSEKTTLSHPTEPVETKWNPAPDDPIPFDLIDPEDGSTSETAGGPEPLPKIPDIPTELPKEPVFTVPVTERIVPLNPVEKLPKDMGARLLGPGDGPGSAPKIPDIHSLDRVPRATVRPVPNYPPSMRDSSTNGSVTVEFVVDTTGRVVTAEAVRWTHRDFVDPAVRAVLLWRFEPGRLNGRKVNFRVAVPIEFHAAP